MRRKGRAHLCGVRNLPANGFENISAGCMKLVRRIFYTHNKQIESLRNAFTWKCKSACACRARHQTRSHSRGGARRFPSSTLFSEVTSCRIFKTSVCIALCVPFVSKTKERTQSYARTARESSGALCLGSNPIRNLFGELHISLFIY